MSTIAVILSFVLALVFLGSGALKFSGTEMAAGAPEHLGVTPGMYKLAGVLELLAAVGLVLAAIGVVSTSLGAAAAFGLALLMAFAVGIHLRVGDPFSPAGAEPGAAWAPAATLLLLSALTGVLILV